MGQHLKCFAAQEQALDAFSTMRCHDNQLGLVLLGRCDDGVRHHIGLDGHRLAADPLGFGRLLNSGRWVSMELYVAMRVFVGPSIANLRARRKMRSGIIYRL